MKILVAVLLAILAVPLLADWNDHADGRRYRNEMRNDARREMREARREALHARIEARHARDEALREARRARDEARREMLDSFRGR